MDTRGEKSKMERKPQQEEKHPSDLEPILEPNHLAGQNIGPRPDEREVPVRTAFDHKLAHALLAGFTDDELKQIPILETESRLEQGATYIDLADNVPHELKATGGMTAKPQNLFVPKNRVPYWIWNRLIGERRP